MWVIATLRLERLSTAERFATRVMVGGAALVFFGEAIGLASVLRTSTGWGMTSPSIALTAGRDPITNDVRSAVRRFPRVTYAMAVVIGLILGHLLWP